MGICGSLMDIFDYPQARSAKKQNKKNPFFILLCIRFALTLHPETQRTDLAACNLSKTMLKLSIVNCSS